MNTMKSRRELSEPGPMIPPVPAVLTTIKGTEGNPDEISVLWAFVVSGKPAQIGVSADKTEHVAERLLTFQRECVLNVVTMEHVHAFDIATWKIKASVKAIREPITMSLSRDGKFLWVVN